MTTAMETTITFVIPYLHTKDVYAVSCLNRLFRELLVSGSRTEMVGQGWKTVFQNSHPTAAAAFKDSNPAVMDFRRLCLGLDGATEDPPPDSFQPEKLKSPKEVFAVIQFFRKYSTPDSKKKRVEEIACLKTDLSSDMEKLIEFDGCFKVEGSNPYALDNVGFRKYQQDIEQAHGQNEHSLMHYMLIDAIGGSWHDFSEDVPNKIIHSKMTLFRTDTMQSVTLFDDSILEYSDYLQDFQHVLYTKMELENVKLPLSNDRFGYKAKLLIDRKGCGDGASIIPSEFFITLELPASVAHLDHDIFSNKDRNPSAEEKQILASLPHFPFRIDGVEFNVEMKSQDEERAVKFESTNDLMVVMEGLNWK